MASKETVVLNQILLKLSQKGYRLFRNNIGTGWMGSGKTIQAGGGDVLLKNARAVAFGVGGEGGSDLIGWRSVEITPDMVGKKIAQFAAVEVKAPGGRATESQINFIKQVNNAGGYGVIADNSEKV